MTGALLPNSRWWPRSTSRDSPIAIYAARRRVSWSRLRRRHRGLDTCLEPWVVQHLGRDAAVIPQWHPVRRLRQTAAYGRWARRSQITTTIPATKIDLHRPARRSRAKVLDVLLAALPLIRQARPDLEADRSPARKPKRCDPGCCNLGTMTPRRRKIALLNSADVSAAPQPARESFGIVLLEAMASGVQIVASDLPSFVDLLGAPEDEERRGDVFTGGDHRALARAVVHALERPNPLQAARAQQTAMSYDWSNVGAAVLAVYRAAMSAAPSGLWRTATDEHCGDAGPDDHRRGALGLADQLARHPSSPRQRRVRNAPGRCLIRLWWDALNAPLSSSLMRGIDPAGGSAGAGMLRRQPSNRTSARAQRAAGPKATWKSMYWMRSIPCFQHARAEPRHRTLRARQYVPPVAQRCSVNGPCAPSPTHRANLAVGEAYRRATSVRDGRWFDLHSDGWPAGFASFVARARAPGRELGWPRER